MATNRPSTRLRPDPPDESRESGGLRRAKARRRGVASAWIIAILVLLILAAAVSWSYFRSVAKEDQATTRPDQ